VLMKKICKTWRWKKEGEETGSLKFWGTLRDQKLIEIFDKLMDNWELDDRNLGFWSGADQIPVCGEFRVLSHSVGSNADRFRVSVKKWGDSLNSGFLRQSFSIQTVLLTVFFVTIWSENDRRWSLKFQDGLFEWETFLIAAEIFERFMW
jgi:hypothetical protein